MDETFFDANVGFLSILSGQILKYFFRLHNLFSAKLVAVEL